MSDKSSLSREREAHGWKEGDIQLETIKVTDSPFASSTDTPPPPPLQERSTRNYTIIKIPHS